MTISGYGSWSTPVTSELVVSTGARPSAAHPDGAGVVWSESRPQNAGRIQLVRRGPGGDPVDVLGDDANVRTAVHEYGGGAWWTHSAHSGPECGPLWYVEWTDQRIRRIDPDGQLTVLTPEPSVARGDRYADGDVAPDGTWMVAIRERHPAAHAPAADVRNEIVRLDARAPSEPEVIVTGSDFVAAPRISRDGGALAWLSWDHPSMPWDDVVLTVRDLQTGRETVVAGGPGESVTEPSWQADESLTFLSDRTGWWNLYRWRPVGNVEPLVLVDAEIGVPGWMLGGSRYATLDDGQIVYAQSHDGYDALWVRAVDGTTRELKLGFSLVTSVYAAGSGEIVCIAGSPTSEPGVYRVRIDHDSATAEAVSEPRDLGFDASTISVPEPISFASVDGAGQPREAYALYYPPSSAGQAPDGELPPVLVAIHGGPTSAAMPVLNTAIQYWTTRGFAVVDVNYGGSTGFGRAYREQLKDAWGIIDVADCFAAARALAEAGRVDPKRMAIRGGSAGGYTTLAALARPDTPFSAGANHFGVADLAALAADTHKFESRYLDGLVGPYPEASQIYRERSPITHVADFATPLIVLQGDEDEVVSPSQSEMIVDALRERQIPVAYLLFTGEQHGFRQAPNIRRALDAELSFYGQVLGFELPAEEGIEPVRVENLAAD